MGCLLTSLATRAVHLEVTPSLETDDLIKVLRQFVNRRGPPDVIPHRNTLDFQAYKHGFLSFEAPLPNVFSRLMLLVVITHSYYSFTSAVNAFQQAPPPQGRKLVICWKS